MRAPSSEAMARGLPPEDIEYYLSILSRDASPSRRAFAILHLRHAHADPFDSRVSEALVAELRSGADRRFRENAALSLGYLINRGTRCPGAPHAFAAAVRYATDDSMRGKILWHALSLLPVASREEAWETYRQLLKDPSAAVRTRVARGLGGGESWDASLLSAGEPRDRMLGILDAALSAEQVPEVRDALADTRAKLAAPPAPGGG